MEKKTIIILSMFLIIGTSSFQSLNGINPLSFPITTPVTATPQITTPVTATPQITTPVTATPVTTSINSTANVTTSITGINIQWFRTYGSLHDEFMFSAIQSTAGKYVLVGSVYNRSTEDLDMMLVMTNLDGAPEPIQKYNSEEDAQAWSVIETNNEEFVLTGLRDSSIVGTRDALIVYTDQFGVYQKEQSYGNETDNWAEDIIQTATGDLILTGSMYNNISNNYDFWLTKINSSGEVEWSQIYGGEHDEWGEKVLQTDEGFIIVGVIYNRDLEDYDVWVVGTNLDGEYKWEKLIGTFGDNWANSAILTNDGGIVIAGSTFDRTNENFNAWLVKTDMNGELIWNKSYGGQFNDEAWDVIQTTDNGYAFTGYVTENVRKPFLIKTDSNGNLQWDLIIETNQTQWARVVIETADSGFILAGTIEDTENEDFDFWMAKVIPQQSPTTTTSSLLTTTGIIIPPMLSEIPRFISYAVIWTLLSLIWFRKKQRLK